MHVSSISYALLLHQQVYEPPLQLLDKVDPPNDIDFGGHHLELWNCILPGAPSSCPRYVDPVDIRDIPSPGPPL